MCRRYISYYVASIPAVLIVLIIATRITIGDPTASSITSTQPTTQPGAPAIAASQPAIDVASAEPTAVAHALFRAIDDSDRKQAITLFQATTPLETSVADAQVDMMLAVARLKKAIREKIGPIDPLALQMAIVSEQECASVSQSIHGDSATVTATSKDDATWTTDYEMVRVGGQWKLSLARNMEDAANNIPPERELAMAKSLVKAVNDTAGAVEKGELKDFDAINQRIEQALAQ